MLRGERKERTGGNKKLLETSASLLVTSALLVVTRSCSQTTNQVFVYTSLFVSIRFRPVNPSLRLVPSAHIFHGAVGYDTPKLPLFLL